MTQGRERPDGVPAGARWDGRERAWGIGEGDVGRKKIGAWRWWDDSGTFLGESTYDGRGHAHGTMRRYHANGGLAVEGSFDTDHRVGLWVWHVPPGASRELLPAELELNAGPEVIRIEGDYAPTGQLLAHRFFAQEGETTLRGVAVGIARRLLSIVRPSRRAVDKAPADPRAFVDSLDRLDSWLKDACTLGQRDLLLARCPGLQDVGGVLVVPTARRAGALPSEAALIELESELGSKLPPSYRAFLCTIGWIDAAPIVRTPRINELATLARSYRTALEKRLGSFGDYEALYAEYLEHMQDKRWTDWGEEDVERILRPSEVVDHHFLPIASENGTEPTSLLALHLRDTEDESPVFGDLHENLQIELIARNAHAWLNALVDEALQNMAEVVGETKPPGSGQRIS